MANRKLVALRKTIYVPALAAKQIDLIAVRRRVSFSAVAAGILADHFDPRMEHLQLMAVLKRLERLEQRLSFVDHAQQVTVEALNLFISTWLTNTAPVPTSQRVQAQARGRERYDVFYNALLAAIEDREGTLLAGLLAEPIDETGVGGDAQPG